MKEIRCLRSADGVNGLRDRLPNKEGGLMETERQAQERKRIAHLESEVDFLETELERLNERLIEAGFDGGIYTLLDTIDEIEEQIRFEEDSE